MGVTEIIVLVLIGVGALTLLIWLARSLPMNASQVVVRVLVAPALVALALRIASGPGMGVTGFIVFALLGVGAAVVVIWLSYALVAYGRGQTPPTPAQTVEQDLEDRSTPRKLEWNWAAFFLGPLWFLARGLWVHTFILTSLLALSGGILLPFVLLYSALKGNETLEDFRLAKLSVY